MDEQLPFLVAARLRMPVSLVRQLPATEMNEWRDYFTGGADREYMAITLLAGIADMMEAFMTQEGKRPAEPMSVRIGIWPKKDRGDRGLDLLRSQAEEVAAAHIANKQKKGHGKPQS